MNRTSLVPRLVLAVGALAAASLSAGETKSLRISTAGQAEAQARQKEIMQARAAGNTPDQFGLACCQILQIPAASFTPISGAVVVGSDTPDPGYVTVSAYGTTFSDMWAAVTLPSGSHVQYLDLYYEDNDATQDVWATLVAYTGSGFISGAPGFTSIATATSSGMPGYGYAVAATDFTIQNNVAFDSNSAQYAVLVVFGSTAGTVKFKGVDLWWNRQISPAPASPTFGDVAPGDFGYQQIEALAASGITGGCGGGNYCPNGTLTRAQMAIFLSKALGLYWPW